MPLQRIQKSDDALQSHDKDKGVDQHKDKGADQHKDKGSEKFHAQGLGSIEEKTNPLSIQSLDHASLSDNAMETAIFTTSVEQGEGLEGKEIIGSYNTLTPPP